MGGCLGSPTANKPYGQQGYGGYPQQQGYGGYPQQQGYGAPGQYGHNFQPNYGPQAGELLLKRLFCLLSDMTQHAHLVQMSR